MARTSALWTRRSTRETTQPAFEIRVPVGPHDAIDGAEMSRYMSFIAKLNSKERRRCQISISA